MRRTLIVIAAALVSGCETVPSPASTPAAAPVIAASHAPPPHCTGAAEPETPADKAALALSLPDCLENPDPARETVFKSEASLARLHNLRAFAQSVYVKAIASDDARMKPVAGAALQFLKALP